ncbi:hypothetical protein CI238_03832, partial [Colletotrichum incanum]
LRIRRAGPATLPSLLRAGRHRHHAWARWCPRRSRGRRRRRLTRVRDAGAARRRRHAARSTRRPRRRCARSLRGRGRRRRGVVVGGLVRGVDRLRDGRGVGVLVPGEEGAKSEVLDDGELLEDFCVEHFEHALVNLPPAVLDARYVKEDGAVLPKRALFHVVDEADGGEVHVLGALGLDDGGLDDVARLGRAADGALGGHGVGVRGDGGRQLGGAEDVGEEGVVVEAPDAVGAGGLEGVGQDEAADDAEVGLDHAEDDGAVEGGGVRLAARWCWGVIGEEGELVERAEEGEEGELVAGAVVQALRGAEGAEEVGEELGRGRVGGRGRGEGEDGVGDVLGQQGGRAVGEELVPLAEGDVAEAAGTRVGGRLVDEGLGGGEEVLEGRYGGREAGGGRHRGQGVGRRRAAGG